MALLANKGQDVLTLFANKPCRQITLSDNVLTLVANCSPTGGINSHYLPTAQGICSLLISHCVSPLHDHLSGRPRASGIQIVSMVVCYTRSRFSPRTFFSTTSFLNQHSGGLSKEPSPIPEYNKTTVLPYHPAIGK